MNKLNKKIFWIVSSVLLAGFALNFLCQFGVKCEKCPRVSQSKAESIEEGFYVVSYSPVTSKYKLRHHDETVTFKEIWVENGWVINSDICLWKRVEKVENFNATIAFEKSGVNTFNFKLEGYGTGTGMGNTNKTITIHSLPDTMIFYMVEKSPEQNVGWRKEMPGDTIVFIKDNN